MKWWILLLIVVLGYLAYPSIENSIQIESNPVVGCWETSQFGYKTVLKFEDDKTLIRETTSEGVQIWEYVYDNDSITLIKQDGTNFTEKYNVISNKVIQLGENSFVKCGSLSIDAQPHNPFG